MKTAEEWVTPLMNQSSRTKIEEVVKLIQLDAYKAGMSEAAKVATSFITGECLQQPCNRCEQNKVVSEAILSARDRKTLL